MLPTSSKSRAALTGLSLLLLALAADARPVRVGLFRGAGSGAGTYWHSNIHTAATVLQTLLADPGAAGLGDSLVLPNQGFAFYATPVAPNTTGGDCAGNGCGPTADQLAEIVRALDTLDVLVLNSNVALGSRVPDGPQRRAFEKFWNTKGVVSIHESIDSRGTWPESDSLHGTRFQNHPAEQLGKVRADSVHAAEPDWRALNRGVFPNGKDTTFFEEWVFFTNSGGQIRSRSSLKPTMNLNDSSLLVGNTGIFLSADHPISWYRLLPTGGRFFYTTLGHRAQNWQGNRTFRRQLYNAILWAARVDSTGTVGISAGARSPVSFEAFPQGRILRVRFADAASRLVTVRALDGGRVAKALVRGEGALAVPRAGVYIVSTREGARRVLVP